MSDEDDLPPLMRECEEEVENDMQNERNAKRSLEEWTEVNELGLKDDGYDYSQHLREMGKKVVVEQGLCAGAVLRLF